MQIDFTDFEPGKPLVIENYGKRLTITVEDLPTLNAQEVQQTVESAYGSFTHTFKVKPNSTYVFGATEQEVKRGVTPVAVPQQSVVEYIYWSSEDQEEKSYVARNIQAALDAARMDFIDWADRPLEIRIDGLTFRTWRKLWQKLTPLPEIGPNDQVVLLINPLDKV